jgi:hypothetical protein
MPLAAGSVYQRALGDAFAGLSPVMQRYFGPLPAGHVGVGEGVYEVVGSRYRRLAAPLLRWSARHDVLFREAGRNVRFVVENRPLPDGGLRGTRWFGFPGSVRVMRDTIHADGAGLLERLGRRGGLEVGLVARVDRGAMVLRSRSLAWRVRGRRIRLPPVATVEVRERDDPAGGGRQRVDVRLRMPFLGEVFRYSGAFAYRIVPANGTVPTVSPALPTLSMWLTENSPN